jgi:hypothetical protein
VETYEIDDAVRLGGTGGRPRSRCARVRADRGCSYPVYRREVRRRGGRLLSPERADHRAARLRRGVRGPSFDRAAYARRSLAERCVLWAKRFRSLATRYEKTAACHRTLWVLAAILRWCKR